MFVSYSEYLRLVSEEKSGTESQKRGQAIRQICEEFKIAVSTAYRLLQDPDYFVYVDYKNHETRILRTSAKSPVTR